MPSVIQVSNLSKIYRLGEIGTGTLSRDLERWYKMKIRRQEDPFLKIGETNIRNTKGVSDIVYSLRDINFEIEQGDAVGIIGKNGAGKSTLLKIISRVTSPTTGKISIKGRVASLLEVGTGFHPELTGRENIYLNGAILGMRKREITDKLDEIIDFSGVERYIDTPVKRYSSGMYVRLAFAVAAHLESEILIVDEVLAVGDAEFQKKCLGKMEDVSKSEGRTVLFVSHNLDAVQRLCTNSILLENGKIFSYDKTESVISKYLNERLQLICKTEFGNADQKDNQILLISASCSDSEGKNKDTFNSNEDIYLNFTYKTKQDKLKFIHGLNIYNEQQINIFNSHDTTSDAKNSTREGNKVFNSRCIIPGNLLNEGVITVSFALFSIEPFIVYVHQKGILRIKIIDLIDGTSARGRYTGGFPGMVRPLLQWSLTGQ